MVVRLGPLMAHYRTGPPDPDWESVHRAAIGDDGDLYVIDVGSCPLSVEALVLVKGDDALYVLSADRALGQERTIILGTIAARARQRADTDARAYRRV